MHVHECIEHQARFSFGRLSISDGYRPGWPQVLGQALSERVVVDQVVVKAAMLASLGMPAVDTSTRSPADSGVLQAGMPQLKT